MTTTTPAPSAERIIAALSEHRKDVEKGLAAAQLVLDDAAFEETLLRENAARATCAASSRGYAPRAASWGRCSARSTPVLPGGAR